MNPDGYDEAIQKSASLLRQARRAVAFTGAGISTPSGIPDFRSARTGLWTKVDPMKVASLTSFRQTPAAFYDWFRPLARTSLLAEPNPAHTALAQLEKAGVLRAVVTQNIDGLHQRAGSKTVYEVHGSMDTLTCPACHCRSTLEDFRSTFLEDSSIPHCPACNQVLKPDIVLFEEPLPMDTYRAAQQACAEADALVVVGSSLEVMPAAGLPLEALERGAPIIVINFTPTYLDEYATAVIPGNVAEVLPRIVQQLA